MFHLGCLEVSQMNKDCVSHNDKTMLLLSLLSNLLVISYQQSGYT